MSEHHVLVVDLDGDDIYVEHPDCRKERYPGVPDQFAYDWYPDCPVENELLHAGFDSLKYGGQFETWPPPDGRCQLVFSFRTTPPHPSYVCAGCEKAAIKAGEEPSAGRVPIHACDVSDRWPGPCEEVAE